MKKGEKMIYRGFLGNKDSFLLATGLELKEIGKILNKAKNEKGIETELKKKGIKYLERYGTFNQYMELTAAEKLKEPIIVILGALPCVGKTWIAKEINTAFSLGNILGGDSFRASLREFVDKEKNPAFFTSVYDSWKFFGGEPTKENIIRGFKKQAEIINQAIERIIVDRGIRDGESMVVEYLHFLPSQYHKETLENISVIPIILYSENIEDHKRNIYARTKYSHLKGGAQRLIEQLDKYRIMQEYQLQEAREYNIPAVNTDDIVEANDKIIEIITERIKKLNKMEHKTEESEMVKKIKEERKNGKINVGEK